MQIRQVASFYTQTVFNIHFHIFKNSMLGTLQKGKKIYENIFFHFCKKQLHYVFVWRPPIFAFSRLSLLFHAYLCFFTPPMLYKLNHVK